MWCFLNEQLLVDTESKSEGDKDRYKDRDRERKKDREAQNWSLCFGTSQAHHVEREIAGLKARLAALSQQDRATVQDLQALHFLYTKWFDVTMSIFIFHLLPRPTARHAGAAGWNWPTSTKPAASLEEALVSRSWAKECGSMDAVRCRLRYMYYNYIYNIYTHSMYIYIYGAGRRAATPPPQWYGPPDDAPAPPFCMQFAAFLPSSHVFSR